MAFRIPLIAVVALLVGLIDLVTTSPPFLSAVNERLAGAFIPIQDWWNGPAGGTGGGDTLRQALQHSTIVQLGEAQHGDGATFERKNAWVRHLHEKFQFVGSSSSRVSGPASRSTGPCAPAMLPRRR